MCAMVDHRAPLTATNLTGVGHLKRPSLYRPSKSSVTGDPPSHKDVKPALPPKSPKDEDQERPALPPKHVFSHDEDRHHDSAPPLASRAGRPALRPLRRSQQEQDPPTVTVGSGDGLRRRSSDPPREEAPQLPPRISVRSRHSDPPPPISFTGPDSCSSSLSPGSPNQPRWSVETPLHDINEEGSDNSRESRTPSPSYSRRGEEGFLAAGEEEKKKKKKKSLGNFISMRKLKPETKEGSDSSSSLPGGIASKSLTGGSLRPSRTAGSLYIRGSSAGVASDSALSHGRREARTMPTAWTAGGAPGERSDEMRLLHRLTCQCIQFLSKESYLREEGLFRVPGNLVKLKQIRQKFLSDGRADFSNIADPHLVAGVLKLHFRELKVSIIPPGNCQKDVLDAAKTRNTALAKRSLNKLPVTNFQVLKALMGYFCQLAAYSDTNLMTTNNIARSCGPSIIHGYGVSDASTVLQFLLDYNSSVLNGP